MKRLLLLGGGHAHVHVLRELARERMAGAEVTLVTPYRRQIYSGMLPGIVAGHYRAEQAAIPLAPLAEAAQVQLLETSVVALQAGARRVRLADGRVLGYEVLSVDTGSVMERGRIPGAMEHALFLRPIEVFLQRFESLLDLAARRELDVVVIGGGAAGVEMALALQHRFAGRGETQARVALAVGGPDLLSGYPPEVVHFARSRLARARVTLFREPCTEVRANCVVLASGARLACDAAIIATGSEAPGWLEGSALALDGRGYIVTGPTLQSGSHAEVFAAGDVASRIDEPHAKSGVYAVRAGPPLLANLRAFIAGTPLRRYVPPRRTLNLISGGARRAIMAYGRHTAEGRWVWWWKHRIDRAFVARHRIATAARKGAATVPSAETR